MIVGTVMCVLLWLRRNEPSSFVRLHEPGVPPPWPGGVGAAVLLRGGAIGAMLTALFLVICAARQCLAPGPGHSADECAAPPFGVPSSVPAFRDDVL